MGGMSWRRAGAILSLSFVVSVLGASKGHAANNPNGFIRTPGWNILILNQPPTGATAFVPGSCNGGGHANMLGNWVPPHNIGTEDPKAGDIWNDIAFGAPKAIGWGGQRIAPDPVWITADSAGNMSPAGFDGVTIVGGINVNQDTVDFNQIVDRVNAVMGPVAGAPAAMPNDNVIAIATTYVRNNNAGPVRLQIGGSSDDSLQIYLNENIVLTHSTCRGVAGDLEDIAGAELPTGISKITAIVPEGGGGFGLRLGLIHQGQRLNDVTGPAAGIEFLGNGVGDGAIVGQAQGADPVARRNCPYGWVLTRAYNILGPLDNPFGGEAGNLQNMLSNWTYPYDLRTANPKSGDEWDIDFTRATATGYAAKEFTDALGLGVKPIWFNYQDLADQLDGIVPGLGAALPGSGESGLPGGNNILTALDDIYRYLSAKLKVGGIPTIDGRNCANPADYNADCDPDNIVTILTTYVRNNTGADLPVRIATSSDDSDLIYVNCQVVTVHSQGRGSGTPAQDVRPAVLPPGISKIVALVFEGGGGHDFRLGIRPFGSVHNFADGSPEIDFLGHGAGDNSIVGVDQFCMDRQFDTDTECKEEVQVTIKGTGKGDAGQAITVIEHLNAYDLADLEITGVNNGGVVSETVVSDVYTNVSSTGGDIWRDCDRFQFDYTVVTGDFDIAIEVLEFGHSSVGRHGKFGPMARADLAANSIFYHLQERLTEVLDASQSAVRRANAAGQVTVTGTGSGGVTGIGADTCDATSEFNAGGDLTLHPRFLRLKRTGQTIIGYRSNDLRMGDGTLDPLVDANWSAARSQVFGASQTDGSGANTTVYTIPALPPDLLVGFANSEHNSKGPALQRVVYRLLPSSWINGDVSSKITQWDTSQTIGTDAGGMSSTTFGSATIGKTITWNTTVGAVNGGLSYTVSSKNSRTSYVNYLPPRRVDRNFVSNEGPTGNTFPSPPYPPALFLNPILVSGSNLGLPVNPKLYEPLNDTGRLNLLISPDQGTVGEFDHAHDIGWLLDPSAPGSASEAGGVYTLKGGGTDIWDGADHFHYAYREISGDFVATARVVDITAPVQQGRWGRAGIMARYTCDPASKYSLACVPYRGEVDANVLNDSRRHQSRREHSPSYGKTNGDGAGTFNRDNQIVPPLTGELDQGFKGWVRLTRIGNYFYSQFALDADGEPGPWVLAGGDHHPAPPAKVFLGLIAAGHNTYGTNLVTVTYDNWSVRSPEAAPSTCLAGDSIWEDGFDLGLDPGYVIVQGNAAAAFTPQVAGGRLKICGNGVNDQRNAVWINTNGFTIADTGFKAEFDAFIGKPTGNDPADGFTFAVVEGEFTTLATGLAGGGGGAMGYNLGDHNAVPPPARPRSFAVELDTWDGGHGDNDPPGQGANGSNQDNRWHMGIDFNFEVQSAVNNVEYGVVLPPLYNNPTLPAYNNPDGVHVEVEYLPADTTGTGASTISVFVTGNDGNYPRTKVLEAKGPRFIGDIFMGFTGATGGANGDYEVDNLNITERCCEVNDSASIAQQGPVDLVAQNVVTLDGSGSSGADGSFTYTWQVLEGNAELVAPASGPKPQLKLNAAGTVKVKLSLADGACSDAATAEMSFSVLCNDPPEVAMITVPAGPHGVGATVVLDSAGSSTGSRAWSIVSGPATIVGGSDGDTVNVRCDGEGEVKVKLTVDDGICANPGSAEAAFTCAVLTNWVRCDCNGDLQRDISDAVFLLGYLFTGGQRPACVDACDCNNDVAGGVITIDISDGVYDLQFQFIGGPPPSAPYPKCDRFQGCEAQSWCPNGGAQ